MATTSLGAAAAATVVWRWGDRMRVTVVVKGTFALVAGGPITPVDPAPLAIGEEPGDGGLRSAGDLAPYAARADVMLVGQAEGAGQDARARAPVTMGEAPKPPARPVGLGVNAAGTWLIRKSVSAPDGRILGLGPVSRRARLAGLVGPDGVLSVPDPFDWSVFQAAPPDQWAAHLKGDEWIALAGVYAGHPVFMTHLAGATAAAKLFGEAPNLRAGKPIPLLADTLLIDASRRCCHIVWRGQFPISGVDALPYLRVVAGIELPGRPLAFIDPFANAPANAAPRPMPPAPTRPPMSAPPPPPPAATRPPMSAPSAPPPPPPAPTRPPMSSPFPAPAPTRPPMSAPAPSFTPLTPPKHPAPAIVDVAGSDWYNSTAPLTARQVAELLAKPALPFETPKAASPAHAFAEPTGIVDIAVLGSVPVTPFGAPPSRPSPSVPPPPLMPSAPVIASPAFAEPALPVMGPPALAAPLPPPPPPVEPALPDAAASLSDDFLGALPKEKEPRLSPTERLAARKRKPKEG